VGHRGGLDASPSVRAWQGVVPTCRVFGTHVRGPGFEQQSLSGGAVPSSFYLQFLKRRRCQRQTMTRHFHQKKKRGHYYELFPHADRNLCLKSVEADVIFSQRGQHQCTPYTGYIVRCDQKKAHTLHTHTYLPYISSVLRPHVPVKLRHILRRL
jgi:hypothetical protein